MYSIAAEGNEITDVEGDLDIETEINKEVEEMKFANKGALFQAVKIDIMCGKLTAVRR